MAIMVIDGEEREVSDDAAKDVLNNENWKAAQHERDAELKEQARLINSEREALAEERKALALERQNGHTAIEEEEVMAKELSLDVDEIEIPNLMDDPEGYHRAMLQRQEALAQAAYIRAKSEAKAETKADIDSVATDGARKSAFAQNRNTVAEFFKENPDISADERKEITKVMDRMLRLDGYGQEDPDSGVFLYGKDAVKKADELVRTEHYRQLAKDEGYQEGLSQLSKGSSASEHNGHNGSARTRIGKNASAGDIYETISNLPPGGAREAVIDQLSSDQLDAFINHDLAQQERALGA